MLRGMKTYSQAPEKFVPGALCKVLMLVDWIGAVVDDGSTSVWLPAKIKKIELSEDASITNPAVIVDIRRSPKYKTQRLENLMILPSQVEDCLLIK